MFKKRDHGGICWIIHSGEKKASLIFMDSWILLSPWPSCNAAGYTMHCLLWVWLSGFNEWIWVWQFYNTLLHTLSCYQWGDAHRMKTSDNIFHRYLGKQSWAIIRLRAPACVIGTFVICLHSVHVFNKRKKSRIKRWIKVHSEASRVERDTNILLLYPSLSCPKLL